MKIETIESHGKTYRVCNGTYYANGTPDEVVNLLEMVRHGKIKVLLRLGDAATGKDWGEENDVLGTIGRSMGPVKAPLLIEPGEDGGGAILTACIVAVVAWKEKIILYRHPQYHRAKIEVVPSDMKGYVSMTLEDGEINARFKSKREEEKYMKVKTAVPI